MYHPSFFWSLVLRVSFHCRGFSLDRAPHVRPVLLIQLS